jgi:GWxTD domain-containing protein
VILTAALFALAAAAHAAEDPSAAGLPLESEGQIRFFVDASCYRGEDGRTDLEIYASVPNDQIRFQELDGDEGGSLGGSLRFAVTVRAESGEEAFAAESVLEPRAGSRLEADDPLVVQALRETAHLKPGTYSLEVQVEDRNAVRTGLLNRIRGRNRTGTAEGRVEARDLSGAALQVSDLTLVRSFRVTPEVVFGRNGVDFDPNPSRYYGLILPSVRCYLEVYGGEDFQEGEAYFLQAQVLDISGLPRVQQTSRAEPRSGVLAVTQELPLTDGLDAGRYTLDLTVVRESTRESARVSGTFDVLWSEATWGRDPDVLLQEMALIMTDSQYKVLKGLTAGAREVYLAEFWHGLDPEPTTSENEVRVAFRERVRRADREFVSSLNRGIDTDRGRVYVRYGPPDEIEYEYSSSGFGLDGATQRIADPAERATLRARPSTSFLDPDEFREGDVSDLAAQQGGATVKSKQFEVWRYDGPGYPLTKHSDRGANSHRGLKFIFADEMGDGNYMLISSSGATIF